MATLEDDISATITRLAGSKPGDWREILADFAKSATKKGPASQKCVGCQQTIVPRCLSCAAKKATKDFAKGKAKEYGPMLAMKAMEAISKLVEEDPEENVGASTEDPTPDADRKDS